MASVFDGQQRPRGGAITLAKIVYVRCEPVEPITRALLAIIREKQSSFLNRRRNPLPETSHESYRSIITIVANNNITRGPVLTARLGSRIVRRPYTSKLNIPGDGIHNTAEIEIQFRSLEKSRFYWYQYLAVIGIVFYLSLSWNSLGSLESGTFLNWL